MCGIFGIDGVDDAANLTYLGLYALQHRGQESAGIVSWDGAQLHVERGMGHVSDIFKEKVLARLPGSRALGHTRYSTSGTSVIANAQPIVVKTSMGPLGIIHNGNLTNAVEIRRRLEGEGSIFQTTSDTEVILHLMAREPRQDVAESFMLALEQVRGAYSLLLIASDCLIAARDPNGFRPLAIGDLNGAPCFASESCAFDLLEALPVRELESRRGGGGARRQGRELPSASALPNRRGASSSTSTSRVRTARSSATRCRRRGWRWAPAWRARRRRWRTSWCRCRTAACSPPWATAASQGCRSSSGSSAITTWGARSSSPSSRSGTSASRSSSIPIRELIAGKRVVLVDDSIVRGTTSRKIVRMVRDAGAAEVHVRISAPPTEWPCHYGIDTPTRGELIASNHTVEEIRHFIEADSLAYLSLDGLLASVSGPRDSYCTACWTGEYRVPISAADKRQAELFPIRAEDGR